MKQSLLSDSNHHHNSEEKKLLEEKTHEYLSDVEMTTEFIIDSG